MYSNDFFINKYLKMKILLINVFMLLTVISISAQIYNRGEIIIEKNAKLSTNSKIEIYQSGKFNNSGKIILEGDWNNQNESGAFVENKGEVHLTGQSQVIKEKPTEFGVLYFLNNTKTKLEGNILVEDKMILKNGSLDLNGYSLSIVNGNSDAIQTNSGNIISENPNSKVTWGIDSLLDEYIIPFSTKDEELIPIILSVQEGTSTNISFNTYPTTPDNLPLPENVSSLVLNDKDVSNSTLDRYWYINTNGSTLNVKISFASKDIDGNQINKNELALLYYNGAEWIVDTTGGYEDYDGYSTIFNKSGWFTLISYKPLSIDNKDDLYQTNALSLYPNPAINTISFEFPKDKKLSDIEVKDLLGRKVFCDLKHKRNNTYTIDISKLNQSTYFISAKQGNNKLYYGKFIKL